MLAKALMPGMPMIIVTATKDGTLVSQLRSLGWTAYLEDKDASDPNGSIHITRGSAQIKIDEQIIHEEAVNPASPDGWWAAVQDLEDRVVVLVVEDGKIDLRSAQLKKQLDSLEGSVLTAHNLLPVTTDLN